MQVKHTMKWLAVCLLWLGSSQLAQALSLGELTVNSRLNDPLDAEIAVHSTDAAELLNARIQLAPYEMHQQQGLKVNGTLRNMKFKAVSKPDGHFAIQISTRRPVREPVLEFIIEVTGASGNLRRSYAMHLDPPTY